MQIDIPKQKILEAFLGIPLVVVGGWLGINGLALLGHFFHNAICEGRECRVDVPFLIEAFIGSGVFMLFVAGTFSFGSLCISVGEKALNLLKQELTK